MNIGLQKAQAAVFGYRLQRMRHYFYRRSIEFLTFQFGYPTLYSHRAFGHCLLGCVKNFQFSIRGFSALGVTPHKGKLSQHVMRAIFHKGKLSQHVMRAIFHISQKLADLSGVE